MGKRSALVYHNMSKVNVKRVRVLEKHFANILIKIESGTNKNHPWKIQLGNAWLKKCLSTDSLLSARETKLKLCSKEIEQHLDGMVNVSITLRDR